MSFSAGVFSINTAGQPVITGTTITATVFNLFTSDIAIGLSTCMLKDGTQTATAGIGFFAGTVSLPGIYFGTDTATGLYRIGLNNTGFAINGTKLLDLSSALLGITGAFTATTTGQVGTTFGVGAATPAASGAGITFPATQSASTNANTLDDYEEGTWTPTMNTNLTILAGAAVQSYIKVGKHVTMFVYLEVSAVSGTDAVTMSLPFTSAAAASNSAGRAACTVCCMGVDTGTIGVEALVSANATTASFFQINDNAASASLTNAHLANTDAMEFVLSYIAAA